MNFGFYDLNILPDPNGSYPSLEDWHKYHFSTVALNHVVDLTEISDQKKKKKGEKVEFALPMPQVIKLPSERVGKLKVLNRLTIIVSDVSQFPKVFQGKASVLRKYDIIAVTPMEQSCLQHACNLNDVDLISIDCQNKPSWKLTKKLYKTALEQHKYFEICYGPALKDSSTLKNTIYKSHLFFAIGRSKNIIFSSGISDAFFLRSPYEIMYLSFLFGFGENKAREAITTNSVNVAKRALKRRQGKGCISVSLSPS